MPTLRRWVLAIHGGAGDLPRDLPGAEVERIRATLRAALEAGAQLLGADGTALDAVQAAVRVMENSGVLNAGRGPALNREGFAQLDAALMEGRTRRAGAVAAVRHVANPIDLARAVMEKTSHVLLVGAGAEQFATELGIARMPDSYFLTERRRGDLHRAIEAARHSDQNAIASGDRKGTVGAVALDVHGDLAAATSTGGMTNKRVGRVGDSALIGAGTYAENGVCAVSATGAGEYFIRHMAAGDVAARIKYQGQDIQVAAQGVISQIKAAGGDGGLIALDSAGRVAMPFCSYGMLCGSAAAGQSSIVRGLPDD